MALTKAEMAERLFDELGLNKREAKEIVELFFESRETAPQKLRIDSFRPRCNCATEDTLSIRLHRKNIVRLTKMAFEFGRQHWL